jgi:UDP-GlcNAc:undecaprenyl-phosphate GlcNAc-1-phosphate transferase
VLAFVVPFLALAVPLMDTLLSIIRRIREGRGIFDADRMHMHHRLLSTQGSHSRAVIFLYLLTACFCAIAVSFTRLEDLAIGSALLVAVLILTFRLVRNLGALPESGEGSVPGSGASAESGDGRKS